MTIHSFGTRCTRVALALAVICLAPTAHAGDVVFDNGVGGAAGIDNAALSDADTSSLGYSNFCADDVWLASGATITGIEWTGAYYFDNRPPDTDDFTISIYADANGPSGAALFTFNLGDDVNRIDSGTDLALFGGFDVYDFSAAINFVLPANTTYWVSITGNTRGDADDFYWGALTDAGNYVASGDMGSTWGNSSILAMDFRLIGQVPAPGALALLGFAAATTGRRRRT
jgi:MYXO-CTERM domain-containing protein